MSKATVSKRYAEALFQLAKEKSIIDQLEAELLIVKEVFESNPKFSEVLSHPRVDNDRKKQLIKDVFKDFSSNVIHTLYVLIDRHNQDAIPQIVDGFVQIANAEKAIADAKVYSVRELSDQEKQQLSNVFSQRLHLKKLNIVNVVDPTILGGVKLRIGNTVYDGTIKGKLERIERNIVSAN